jgi:3-phytase
MFAVRNLLWEKSLGINKGLLALSLAAVGAIIFYSPSTISAAPQDKPKANGSTSVKIDATVTGPLGKKVEPVYATVETQPVVSTGDAADDPAIWIHPEDPALSTIIGTNKQAGIAVYDLSGKEIQFIKAGQINNADIRRGFKLGSEDVALVTGSNRTNNTIVGYKVNPKTRLLEDVMARKVTSSLQVYGSCMYRSPKTAKTYYFVTSKAGNVEQWELFDNGSGKVDAKKVRGFKVGGVVEGCVADDELGHLYISEETIGLWKYNAEPDADTSRKLVDKVAGGNLVADVEGVTIAYGPSGTGHLIVSSQGNHTFVVYKREGDNEYVKTFRVSPGEGIDGSEETDGIDVFVGNLGPQFPYGVFVAHDGYNDKGNQNFKLVPLERILPVPAARADR